MLAYYKEETGFEDSVDDLINLMKRGTITTASRKNVWTSRCTTRIWYYIS